MYILYGWGCLLAVNEEKVFFCQLVVFHVTHFSFLGYSQWEGLGGTARALGSCKAQGMDLNTNAMHAKVIYN